MAVPLLAMSMHAFLGDFCKPYNNEDMTIIRIYEFSTNNNFCPIEHITAKQVHAGPWYMYTVHCTLYRREAIIL